MDFVISAPECNEGFKTIIAGGDGLDVEKELWEMIMRVKVMSMKDVTIYANNRTWNTIPTDVTWGTMKLESLGRWCGNEAVCNDDMDDGEIIVMIGSYVDKVRRDAGMTK